MIVIKWIQLGYQRLWFWILRLKKAKVSSKSLKKWKNFTFKLFFLEIELIHPENADLSEDERKNISYMAFPDNSGNLSENTKFHFNLRTKKALNEELSEFSKECKQELKADEGHFNCYAFFRWEKMKFWEGKDFNVLSKFKFLKFRQKVVLINLY